MRRGDKFQAIREVLSDNPNLPPQRVIRLIHRQYGLVVSQSSVQRVRQHLAGKLPPSVRARTEQVQQEVSSAPQASLTLADISDVRALATRLGGIERLMEVARAMGLAA